MNALLKFVLTMAITISVGVASPVLAQKVVQVTNSQGEVAAMSMFLGKTSPDVQLPIKVASISISPVVLLVEEKLKNPLAADAPNRAQAQTAAEVLAKQFFGDLEKAGVKTNQNAEAVLDIRLYYSNMPGKFKLSAFVKIEINGKAVIGTYVVQGNDVGVKEHESFIKTAGATLAFNIAKSIVVAEGDIVTSKQ